MKFNALIGMSLPADGGLLIQDHLAHVVET